jgi:acyl-coenzyme A synthetase/AMP-(fatty) acid ligase
LGFANGQWVEVSDDSLELNGLPGELIQIQNVNAATKTITLQSAPALTFIRDAADFRRGQTWSFRELLAKVTQAANLFHAVGVGANDVIAYALPNLPQTHFALWGAEAAGIAMAINPALPSEQTADLLRAAGARVLVAMAPTGAADLLATLAPQLPHARRYARFRCRRWCRSRVAGPRSDGIQQGDGLAAQ